MNETEISVYRMNPAEDRIIFGDELREDMWVLCDDPTMRRPYGEDEDSKIRQQRFRRVTRLRHEKGEPDKINFVAEWIDGYQEVHRYAVIFGWIVKKDAIAAGDENYGIGEGVTEG